MSPIPDLLKSLSFAATHPVAGRASVADLFKPKGRCGIYVLHFATGERYIGQALDVTRRYVQHCKTHGDIEQLSFKRVARKDLNEAERQTIWAFERQGIPLRNITFTRLLLYASYRLPRLSDRRRAVLKNTAGITGLMCVFLWMLMLFRLI